MRDDTGVVVQAHIVDATIAVRMASTHPAALIAPALAAWRIALLPSEIDWSPGLMPLRVRCGDLAIENPWAAR